MVGRDVKMEEVLSLDEKTLVGFFSGRKVAMLSLGEWVKDHWNFVLGYSITHHVLPKGWVGLVLKNKEDSKRILAVRWM